MSNESTKVKPSSNGKRRLAVGIVGSLLTLCGLLCGLFWDDMFNSLIDKAMTLRPNSRIYEFWKSPPLEVVIDIYLFNWTNPQDFHNLSTKPILQQVGPYRFTELPNKVDIKWHPENATVSYRRQSHYKFIAAESQGSITDRIIQLNPMAVAASGKAKRWNSMRRGMIDIALKVYGDEISVTKSVDELLFNGYDDVLLDVLNAVPTLLSDIEVPFDKFGYCYTRNGSSTLTGLYNVFTGADDISKLGKVNTWNHKTHTGKFGSQCGSVNGSAGEFQPPNLKVNGLTHIFIPELCRTMPLEYVDTVNVEGLKGYKYIGGLRAVDNGTLYPENKCYCAGECVPSGLMNISSCWYDAPIFMSYPHFYNADPSYVDAVVGLNPNQDEHECYIILEPRTGFVLDVAARFQVNLMVEPLPYLDMFKRVPRVFFPLLWFEEKVRITPELAAELKWMPVVLLVGKVVAALIFFTGIGLMAWYRMEKHLSKARCMELKLGLEENEVANRQENLVKDIVNSALVDQTILRDEKLKVTKQSKSFDSGCPQIDSISNTSAEVIMEV